MIVYTKDEYAIYKKVKLALIQEQILTAKLNMSCHRLHLNVIITISLL